MIKHHKKSVLFVLCPILVFSNVVMGTYQDSTLFRSRCSQRLQRSIDLLKRISCKKEWFFERHGCNCTFVSHYHFHNYEIAQCVKAMEKSKNFVSLITLSHDFSNHSYLHDNIFAREYLVLIFIIYRNLIINNAIEKNMPLKKSMMYVMAEVYEAVDSIPPDKILEAIELLTNELPSFLEQYEFNSDMSWKQWLRQYWWVPPVLFFFGIKLFTILLPPRKSRKRKSKKRLKNNNIVKGIKT